jgi:hypothetical protein
MTTRGVRFNTVGAARAFFTSIRDRLDIGAICDCPRHNRDASGYDVCTCAGQRDVDPACPHVRRWRIDVYVDPDDGSVTVVPLGPMEARVMEVAADIIAGVTVEDVRTP